MKQSNNLYSAESNNLLRRLHGVFYLHRSSLIFNVNKYIIIMKDSACYSNFLKDMVDDFYSINNYCIVSISFFQVLKRHTMDHRLELRSSVAPLPRDRNRRSGQPHQTWLCTVESGITPLNIGLTTAYH